MKNFTLPFLTFVLLSTFSYTSAQCPPGDVPLNNQAQVDAFIAEYPNCSEINGNLKIGAIGFGAYSNIDNISGLGSINRIMGDLLIVNNNELTNIQGLSQLSYVEGNVHVFYNEHLTNLTGLANLQTINGSLKFLDNPELTTIGGMQDLISVGADMEIAENVALTNLDAFGKLTTIGGYLTIRDNSTLANIHELSKLGAIGGRLSINNNTLIQNLQGLESLATLGGDFNLALNENLTEIGDLSPMMQTSSMLRVAYNPNLSDCAAQAFCDHISNGGGVEIIGNAGGCSTVLEIENSCPMTLPVELSGFRAEVKNKSVVLTWKTLTENNNEGFEIQRSNDAINWTAIAWEVGQGNATTTQTYTFTDSRPILGKSYYRLAQTDVDGKIEHSEIVIVSFYNGVVSVYPNPVDDVLQITVADDMPIENIVVYNTSGSEVMRETAVSNNLNVARLNSGTYIIAIQVGEIIRKEVRSQTILLSEVR